MRIALVRGNSLNEWEGALWGALPPEFSVTGFCSVQNAYPTTGLPYSVIRLPSSSDNRIGSAFAQATCGQFVYMRGLEGQLDDFDVVHTAELYYAYSLQAVRAKKANPRLKVVSTLWDTTPARFDKPSFKNFVIRRKMRKIIAEVIAGTDLFLPVSEAAATCAASYGVPREKMTIIPPAIVPIVSDSDASLASRFGVSDQGYYLAVNRLVPEKGTHDVIMGWQAFKAAHLSDRTKLVVVGAGPEDARLRALARTLGVSGSVIFTGPLPHEEACSLYHGARALVLASVETPAWAEQFGYVLAEALSLGCPVIGARSGSIPDVVGGGGIIVPPANPQDIALAFGHMADTAIRQSLSEAARIQSAQFSAERFTAELSAAYRRVVA